MNIIFKGFDNNILMNLDFSKIDIEDIIFGCDKVKEILITNKIKTFNDCVLNDIYQKLSLLDKTLIKETLIYYDKEHYLKYNFSIEAFYYRIQDYSKERQIELLEKLSIRFKEDNLLKFNKIDNLLECNFNCKYLKLNFCSKYNKKLDFNKTKFIVCKNCFLDMWPSIGEEIYNTMNIFYERNEK